MSVELLTIETLILIFASYLGAFLISITIRNVDDEIKNKTLTILLYGTVGWIAGIIFRNFAVENLSEISMLMMFIAFALLGMISYVGLSLIVNLVKN